MNFSMWIIIGESVLILVSLVIGIVVYAWRKKRRLLAALDILLSNISEAEPERKKSLIGRLKKTYPINDAKAEQLSDEIFHSERLFIKKLIQLLLGSRVDEIDKFNEEVYKLSTPYWELLPLDLETADPPKDQIKKSADIPATTSTQEPDDQPNGDQDPEISISITVEEDSEAEITPTEAMPNSEIENTGVVSSNETVDQSTPKQDQSEPGPSENTNDSMPAAQVEENAGEPSWDDAFDQAAQTQGANEVKQERDSDGGNEANKIPESETAS